MGFLTGGNIANVELIKVVTIEDTPVTYYFKTATSISFTASVSAGAEQEQKIKNAIMGMILEEDVLKGYDLEIEDGRLIPEILALVDGGTLVKAESGGSVTGYRAPVAGSAPKRTRFQLTAYSSNRDADGEVLDYNSWSFPSCKGSPYSGGATDGSFQTNKYTIKSRPAMGVVPMEWAVIEELPTVS